jgi:hypothetical protein
MVKRRGPSSQGWSTFLRNHLPEVAAMDLFVVPTIGFDMLYGPSLQSCVYRKPRPGRNGDEIYPE